ncbi:RNA helicase [Cyanobium sp. CH-040]|uniref:RNA helicase n=1 Tax=Cyanobium sp. CH-040 TaxID=2823708 RepID=UPI0020CCD5E3|nr:RNA helicase [Cyanobium sp. CH-040]MCP9928267.1 RNA helicase [Cyanobium sp. CH-040]
MPERRSDQQRPYAEPLEQGLDRLVNAGRQLVDGVSGARPGSRSGQRPAARPGTGPGPGRSRLGDLGRWVEDRLDWILEDEDDWREPWQEPRPRRTGRLAPVAGTDEPPPPAGGRRRPLEAISRRADRRLPAAADGWPDDTSFSRPRWQRPLSDPGRAPDLSAEAAREASEAARAREAERPLPRSSRRRPG